MPKMKTNRAAAKRFRKTAGNKIKRGQAYRRHLLTSKPSKVKRRLRRGAYVSAANHYAVSRQLPN